MSDYWVHKLSYKYSKANYSEYTRWKKYELNYMCISSSSISISVSAYLEAGVRSMARSTAAAANPPPPAPIPPVPQVLLVVSLYDITNEKIFITKFSYNLLLYTYTYNSSIC